MLALLIAYAAAAALLTVTPGADTLLVLRFAAGRGARAGLVAGAGILLGVLVWGAIVAVGVAALIVAHPVAFDLLRVGGALYLVWLGVQLLSSRPSDQAQPPQRLGSPFVAGLLTNLLNPKVGVFYLAFLPQFVPAGVPEAPWILLLAAIHALLGLAWFIVLVATTDRASKRLRGGRVERALSTVTGLLFVGFGVRLLLSESR